MKTTVALSFLIVLCAVDATNLNILRAGVQKSKTTVEINIRQLERLSKNTAQDTVLKVKNKYIEQMQQFNDYSNPTINAIRKEVEEAKAKGKNAQPCYDTAINNLRNIGIAVRKDSQRCVDTAESNIKSELGFIEPLITVGNKLNRELNNIFPSCISGDLIEMQNCITVKLGQTNIVVRIFENDAKSAGNTAKSASNNVILRGNNCLYDAYSPAQSQITEVRVVATRCLNTA